MRAGTKYIKKNTVRIFVDGRPCKDNDPHKCTKYEERPLRDSNGMQMKRLGGSVNRIAKNSHKAKQNKTKKLLSETKVSWHATGYTNRERVHDPQRDSA